MSWIEWTLGIVGSIVVLTAVWIGRAISGLPREYVPRRQVDARFRELEDRLTSSMASQEQRSDRQFSTMDGKLDRILDKLDQKADK